MPVYDSEISIPQKNGTFSTGTYLLKNLTDVTVLFGRNGSGKSLLLRAWRDLSEESVHYVTPERTGEMDFQPQFLQEELTARTRKNASTRNYMPDYRRRIISRIQTYFLTRGDYREEKAAPASPHEIEKFINSLLPDFSLELIASGNPPYKLTRSEGEIKVGGVDHLSSGEAQLITICLDILTISAIWEIQNQDKRILLVDEPDAHIHPDLQSRFAEFIFRLSERFKLQVVVATHSTSLLAALGQFGGLRTSAIYLYRNRHEYQAQPFGEFQKNLSACLGGHVLMGPLFGDPLLLVEGDDDYRIWSQVPRHHVTSFAVLPAQGEEIKRYQKVLEEIFESLRDNPTSPCGYALMDSDKSLPMPNNNNPQKHIRFMQLACHESENLYLTDEVLADLQHTWDSACIKIAAEADKFGSKSNLLRVPNSWDRKSADVKPIINEIAQILDPKPIHWTVRVGQAIGRKKPEGQLANFLGELVLEYLWGANPKH